MHKKSPFSVDQDVLALLRDRGVDSGVLDARISYVEDEGLRRNVEFISKHPRLHPEILPTQSSGRWSTTNPPLVNFKRKFWKEYYNIILPDLREWWLEWDWSGIEARMFTAYSGDSEDVEWLRRGVDIHTETCRKYLFAWEELPSDWTGSKDERRIKAKNVRYGVLQYGKGARAVLTIPGIEYLGIDREELVANAQRFLNARPKGVAFKHRVWEEGRTNKMTRTFMGRRRKLFGDRDARAKEGMAHMISGSVADMMDWCLISLHKHFGDQFRLIINRHDGALIGFPNTLEPLEVVQECRKYVEREWEFAGSKMKFPASWSIFYPDGSKEELK